MRVGLPGFPVLEQLNEARTHCFKASHKDEQTHAVAVINWLGHKVLTVTCLPSNIAGVGIGVAGMAVTACTLGALKVAIYAVTLGNVEHTFPIGFIWSGKRALNAGAHVAINLGEVIYDAANIFYLGYRAIRWIGEKLHLGHFINEIFHQLGKVFKFINNEILTPLFKFVAKRIEKGMNKAIESEGNFKFTGETPSLIKPLDEETKKTRIDFHSPDRPLMNIFKHYVLSVANIPVNMLTATGAGIASLVLGSAFVSKVALYAATNIHIPVPTFAGQAIDATSATIRNSVVDIGTNAADSFVLLYKTSSALGINRAVATALQIVLYIPKAVLS